MFTSLICHSAVCVCRTAQTTSSVLFDSIQAFSFDKRLTDLNPSASRKNSSSFNCVALNAKNQQLWYFFKRSHSVQSPTLATSQDGSLLKHLFFPLWTTFSTQTSLVFSRRRPQTRPGCLRSLLSTDAESKPPILKTIEEKE